MRKKVSYAEFCLRHGYDLLRQKERGQDKLLALFEEDTERGLT